MDEEAVDVIVVKGKIVGTFEVDVIAEVSSGICA